MTAQKPETIIRDLLVPTGIEINGKNLWDIQVHNSEFYGRVLRDASLGLGEAYMDGWWDCEAIDQFIFRILNGNLDAKVKGDWQIAFQVFRSRFLNLQTRSRALK